FIPASLLHSRTHRGLAQVFVATHLLGAVGALAIVIRLASLVPGAEIGIYALALTALIFAALPFVLQRTGNIALVGFISFETLAVAALIGTFEYGGFGSPFLPWLLVSLM